MGIRVEFNPDLALRNYKEYKAGRRLKNECVPEILEVGKIYQFLKKDQRNYWLEGKLPLLETKGDQKLSRPIASIKILEATHFIKNDVPYTKGKYQVIEIFHDNKIHFESYKKL